VREADATGIRFGRRVRELRRASGLTQERLAHRSGLHPTYIAGIELGKRNPTLVTIEKIADALEIHISELFPRIDGA
jgi:transcriptional regulator with XRE-family HTH domain